MIHIFITSTNISKNKQGRNFLDKVQIYLPIFYSKSYYHLENAKKEVLSNENEWFKETLILI